MANEKDYIIANGPEGLEEVLTDLLEKSKKDPIFARLEHFVLYQIGEQKSLIKVDFNQQPVKFWYYDLQGRAATIPVKEVITKFLWEKCGGKEQYLKEQTGSGK